MTVAKVLKLASITFDVSDDPTTQGQVFVSWLKTVSGRSEEHRLFIDVDTDLNAALEADGLNLEQQGFERPSATVRAIIDGAAAMVRTPEVVAAVSAARKANREKLEAEAEARATERKATAEAEQKRFDDAVAAAVERLTKKPA
jgi:hypothetical protein